MKEAKEETIKACSQRDVAVAEKEEALQHTVELVSSGAAERRAYEERTQKEVYNL